MLRGGKALQVSVVPRGSDEREKKFLYHLRFFLDPAGQDTGVAKKNYTPPTRKKRHKYTNILTFLSFLPKLFLEYFSLAWILYELSAGGMLRGGKGLQVAVLPRGSDDREKHLSTT